ncbi:DivIVA domain-containing protein [Cutibacterium namnetense]|uniref:DivIVA domain protein n=2 Tax=Cutibacterium namnetense TaxID=1574624 RepID=F9NVD4_9ACTN|nr:DivIVA domain-containing protein [Cutibacterium namnetense]EGR97017.1 DivIVA domain protein [ [[Propionibacterium] namnetense SK182B-JCVI]REB70262.1 DivIVA domain-containing protein [Cutibacterium namnetense]TKW72385.1 MAG: DivIVA domain-containing protein [Cutibacterium acnes]
MAWLLAAVVIIVIGLAVMAGAGKFGQVPAVVDDRPVPDLPEGDLDAESLRSARFAVVPRGYSMCQVDQLLERLAAQMEAGQGPNLTRTGQPIPDANDPDTE